MSASRPLTDAEIDERIAEEPVWGHVLMHFLQNVLDFLKDPPVYLAGEYVYEERIEPPTQFLGYDNAPITPWRNEGVWEGSVELPATSSAVEWPQVC